MGAPIPSEDAAILWLEYLAKKPLPDFTSTILRLEVLVGLTGHKEAGAWIFARLHEAENEYLRRD